MTDISIDAGGKRLSASIYGLDDAAPVLFAKNRVDARNRHLS